MKRIILLSLLNFLFSTLSMGNVNDTKVGGTIYLDGWPKGKVYSGELLIKAFGISDEKSPVAQIVVKNPRFPQAYVLTPLQELVAGGLVKEELKIQVELSDDKGMKKAQNLLSNAKPVVIGERKADISLTP